MFAYDTLNQLAQRRMPSLGAVAAYIAILIGVAGLASTANAILPPSGHGYHPAKLSSVVPPREQQTACAWCGRAAHDCCDDLVVATSPSGDVLESAETGLKLNCASQGLALIERTFAPAPPVPTTFKPRGPPPPV